MKKRKFMRTLVALFMVLTMVLSTFSVTALSDSNGTPPVIVGEGIPFFPDTNVFAEGDIVSIQAATPPPGRQFTRWVTNRDTRLVFANGTTRMCEAAQFYMPAYNYEVASNTYRHNFWVRAIFDYIPASDSVLFSTVYYLAEVIGIRWRGSPNEERAAQWVADQFASFGLISEVYTKDMGNYHTYANRWLENHPSPAVVHAGRVMFDSNRTNIGDVMGNVNTAAANIAGFGTPTGQLVDFGVWPGGIVVPSGLTGDVVAAIRFYDNNPSTALATAALAAIAAENNVINITGLIASRTGGVLRATRYGPTNAPGGIIGPGGLPTITMAPHQLERALANADYFIGMTHHSHTQSFSAKGILPAATDDPDLLIVFVAHLDSVMSAAGADDNASGVASVLAMAEHFAGQDIGNIEMWFFAAGGEEGNGMSGAVEAAQRVVRAGHREIAIAFNQDMIASPGTISQFAHASFNGMQLDTLGIDIYPTRLAGGLTQHTYGWSHPVTGAGAYYAVNPFNLPAHLIITHAKEVGWEPQTPLSQDPRNIQNIRMYREGFTDHQEFGRRGIENASGIICEDPGNGLGLEYHRSMDNIWENYSYDRHNLVFNIFRNAVQTAIDKQVTKRALLVIDEDVETVTLVNAAQLFGFVDSVWGNIGGVDLKFTPGNTVICIAAASGHYVITYGWDNLTAAQENTGVEANFSPVVPTYERNLNPFTNEVVDVMWAFGTGIADFRNTARNARYNQFSTTLRAEIVPKASFNIFNNGQGGTPSMPNESLAAAGITRMWTQLNGVNAPFALATADTITAYDQDDNCAMEFIRVGRRWQDGTGWLNDFNLIDVNKNGQWQYINFTITVYGQTVEVLLVNDLFAPPPVPSFNIFNNGEGGTVSTPNASLAAAGIIRMWTQLDGIGAPFAYGTAATIIAYDQDDNCAMEFVRVNRRWVDGAGWQDDFASIDVNKNGQWQYINFTITVLGQTVEVLLANDLFVPLPVPGFNIFNNGAGGTVSTPNASLAASGTIRMWTQLDGVGAPFDYATVATITAYDQDNNCAMGFVRVSRRWQDGTGWLDDFNLIDVNRNGPWQSINFSITVYGQTVEILLVND